MNRQPKRVSRVETLTSRFNEIVASQTAANALQDQTEDYKLKQKPPLPPGPPPSRPHIVAKLPAKVATMKSEIKVKNTKEHENVYSTEEQQNQTPISTSTPLHIITDHHENEILNNKLLEIDSDLYHERHAEDKSSPFMRVHQEYAKSYLTLEGREVNNQESPDLLLTNDCTSLNQVLRQKPLVPVKPPRKGKIQRKFSPGHSQLSTLSATKTSSLTRLSYADQPQEVVACMLTSGANTPPMMRVKVPSISVNSNVPPPTPKKPVNFCAVGGIPQNAVRKTDNAIKVTKYEQDIEGIYDTFEEVSRDFGNVIADLDNVIESFYSVNTDYENLRVSNGSTIEDFQSSRKADDGSNATETVNKHDSANTIGSCSSHGSDACAQDSDDNDVMPRYKSGKNGGHFEKNEVIYRNKRNTHCLVTDLISDQEDINYALSYLSGMQESLPIHENDLNHPTVMESGRLPGNACSKTLWMDLEVVRSNPKFIAMSPEQRQLHEAKFEIVSSEATYIRLLNTFEKQKLLFPTEDYLTESVRQMLFSRMTLVKQCSETFFEEMETCWQESVFLDGIFEVILKHATNNFKAYVKYSSTQAHANNMFSDIKKSNGKCDSLIKAFHSFLILPMQRITRLPLLVSNVLERLALEDVEYASCKMALQSLRKLADQCNEDVGKDERMSVILTLSKQIEFPDGMKAFPIISVSRWLVKKGVVTMRWHEHETGDTEKSSLGLKHIFLFNDLLLICRKKSEERYKVHSYCRRNLTEMTALSLRKLPNLPSKLASDRDGKYAFLILILSNQENRRETMLVTTSTSADRDDWLRTVPHPPANDVDKEVTFDPWDCPLVMVIESFIPTAPYHLAVNLQDKLHVFRQTPDGWYEGERLSDGMSGVFPINCTTELESPNKFARAVRKRFTF